MLPPSRSALVYGDVDLGLIDGSAVWVTSVVEGLVRAGCWVTLQLKAARRPRSPLLDSMRRLPGVELIDPPAARLKASGRRAITPREATMALRELDAREHFDLIVVRGFRVASFLAREPAFRGRLWTYLTDIPQSVVDLDPASVSDLRAIAEASRLLLCQTEDLRSYLESIVPAAVGRTVLLPPMVPPADIPADRPETREGPLRLVYTGKFAPRWKTLEMAALPARLAERGVEAELHFVGDKVHFDPQDETFHDRMAAALRTSPGVVWHGGASRETAMRVAAEADIGLSWRDGTLDASLELSTKILEYGVLDLPVVLNRTPMHERLLGPDYPLFASSEDDVLDAVVDAAGDPSVRAEAAARLRAAASEHSIEQGADRIRAMLDQVHPPALQAEPRTRPLRIGVASHDLKFFTAILAHLRSLPDVEVRLDEWPALSKQDLSSSQALVEWADIVICEWCGPNAVWYSRHRRTGQRLIVRLHRFELDGVWPSQLAIDAVDRVVCVSKSYAALTQSLTGWPAAKVVVIPNWVDDRGLDRPKLEGARFHLGFIGMAPARKRLDRALDVLESVRARDERFRLFVKTKLTWDYAWIWRKPDEQEHVRLVMRRLQTSPALRGSVVFDGFGPDVASWLRRIGFVLSTSDDESFHLAPAEGMASGAVPAILDWPGADTIYDGHWIHRSTDEIADFVSSVVNEGRWDAERDLARAQAREGFALDRVCAMWDSLIADPDRAHFDSPAGVDGGSPRSDVEGSAMAPVLPYGRR
jgi:glycosyltransferase involved in cell wall biosynthesis